MGRILVLREFPCVPSNMIGKFQAGRVHGVPVALGVLEKANDAVDHFVPDQHAGEVVVVKIHAGSEEFQRH